MKLGSLFDGSGGFPLAGAMHGITPVWASEVEPYPIRVTKARFPGMKHLGSVLEVNGAEVEPVDIITFGSPCQDLSVAGKQAGLHKGERSNLFFEAIRIIKEMRKSTDGKYPRIAVWENVPGAYSSNKGEDFRAVLQAFCSIKDETADVPRPAAGKWNPAGAIVGNGWSVAWRTFDAQFWGVPQRRKRIYLVADFGSERAGEILFEQEGVRRHSAPGGTAGESAAGDVEGSAGRSGECLTPWDVQSRRVHNDSGAWPAIYGGEGGGHGYVLRQATPADFKVCADGISPTLPGQMGTGGNNGPMVMTMESGQPNAGIGINLAPCLNSSHEQPILITKPQRRYIIRRLTPLECCRLQGFPDWWEDGVQGSDSARYKMWGNGIALPNAAHVIGCAKKLMPANDTQDVFRTGERNRLLG